MKSRYARTLAIALSLAFATSACGDDPKPAKKGKKARAKKKKKAKKSKKGGVQAYTKVPDDLRYKLSDVDFRPDPKGDSNRDPFRSYIVSQPDENEKSEGEDARDVCRADNSHATKYSLRSLKLIGIVQGGKKSHALFRDTSGYGHIVQKSDCLGKEAAVIDDIGVGLVRLEVAAEATTGTTAPPQMRTIALHPDESVLDPNERSTDKPGPTKD